MAFRTDDLDFAADLAARERANAEALIRQSAASMPAGVAGECELCGEWSGRLVKGACSPCRDKYRLP